MKYTTYLKVAVFLQYILALTTISVLIWVSFRGLDITDESFYLVGYLREIEPSFGFTYFHKIYIKYFGFLNLGIIEIRILRIVLSLLISFLFAKALAGYLYFIRVIEERKWAFHILLGGITIGSLMGYTWLPQTMSYNTFSYLFLSAIITFYLFGEVCKSRRTKIIFSFLVGFFLAASFYNKFPNLITSLTAILIFSAFFRQIETLRQRVTLLARDLVVYFLGFIAFTFILFGDSFTELSKYVGLLLSSGDSTSTNFIEIYWQDFLGLIERTYPFIISIAFYSIITFIIRSKNKEQKFSTYMEIIPVLLILLYIIVSESYMGGASRKHLLFDFYFVNFILFNFILILNKDKIRKKFNQLIIFDLFVLSFMAGSLGTNNRLTIQSMIYLGFLILPILTTVITLRKIAPTLIYTIVIFIACSQIVTSMILEPYREIHGILAQKYKITDIKRLNNLQVDSATYDLKRQLENVKKAEPNQIFVYGHQTGVALLTDKEPYGFGWYSPQSPSFSVKLIQNANEIDEKDLIFVIPSTLEMHEDVRKALYKRGINFPKDYYLAEQIKFEDCQKGQIIDLNIYYHQNVFGQQ